MFNKESDMQDWLSEKLQENEGFFDLTSGLNFGEYYTSYNGNYWNKQNYISAENQIYCRFIVTIIEKRKYILRFRSSLLC